MVFIFPIFPWNATLCKGRNGFTLFQVEFQQVLSTISGEAAMAAQTPLPEAVSLHQHFNGSLSH